MVILVSRCLLGLEQTFTVGLQVHGKTCLLSRSLLGLDQNRVISKFKGTCWVSYPGASFTEPRAELLVSKFKCTW